MEIVFGDSERITYTTAEAAWLTNLCWFSAGAEWTKKDGQHTGNHGKRLLQVVIVEVIVVRLFIHPLRAFTDRALLQRRLFVIEKFEHAVHTLVLLFVGQRREN